MGKCTVGDTQLQGKRILLAEDNPVNRLLASATLEQAGFVVTEAENGLQALELAKTHDFDLLLMDIQMPVMDGLCATRLIRELDKSGTDRLPMLAFTAGVPGQDRDEILASGMNGCLEKPFASDALVTTVRRYLQPARENPVHMQEPLSPTAGIPAICPRRPCLDIEEGIRRVGGDGSLYRELLRRFVAEYGADADHVMDSVNSGELGNAGRIAHSVKGIAGVLAADSLLEIARELETALKNDGENPHPVMERFRDELSAVLSSAENELRNLH